MTSFHRLGGQDIIFGQNLDSNILPDNILYFLNGYMWINWNKTTARYNFHVYFKWTIKNHPEAWFFYRALLRISEHLISCLHVNCMSNSSAFVMCLKIPNVRLWLMLAMPVSDLGDTSSLATIELLT